MKISMQEAEIEIGRIEHTNCQLGMPKHWRKERGETTNDTVSAQSICWLFCWAKTGQNRKKAQRQAQGAFNKIFNVSYDWLCQRLDHRLAMKWRYSQRDVKNEFYSHIGTNPAEQ